ncbi:MAG: hypothetical protein QM635_03600 [Microbacteriaceae bacterium]
MILTVALLALLLVLPIAATVYAVARDGYRPVPTRSGGDARLSPAVACDRPPRGNARR